MNFLVTSEKSATMTSMEISELVVARHDSVKRTVDRCVEKGAISPPPSVDVKIQRERREETVSVYCLSKRDSLIVVAQMCPEYTAKIVDRWQELEEQVAKPAFDPASLTRMDILKMAVDSEERCIKAEAKVITLETTVQAQAPKVEALNRIAISDGSFSLREAAKVLQVKEKDFLQFLHSKSWTYRMPTGQRWMAHATTLRQGYMEHKTTTGEKDDGSQWTSSQAKITPRGIAKLAMLLGVDISQNDPDFSLVA